MTRAVILAALLAIVAGCSTDYAKKLCDAVRDCEGLDDQAYDQCVEGEEEYIDEAFAAGCEKEVRMAFGCVGDDARCEDDMLDTTPCAMEFEDLRYCVNK